MLQAMVVNGCGENCVVGNWHSLTNVYLHVAQWVSELALSVPNNNASDAFLSPCVLSALRVAPVGVSILFREDLTLQGDQVTRLAIAANWMR